MINFIHFIFKLSSIFFKILPLYNFYNSQNAYLLMQHFRFHLILNIFKSFLPHNNKIMATQLKVKLFICLD